MTEHANEAPTQYRIGAVSRMTGISPDALRIWERRYAAVSPQRSPGGDTGQAGLINMLVASMTSPSQAFSRDQKEFQLLQAIQCVPRTLGSLE